MHEDTKKVISPGKWRGLQALSTDSGSFGILAFDQRGNYRRIIGDNVPFRTAAGIKTEVVTSLTSSVSGVLLDFVYGHDAAMQVQGAGLLMALEKTGYSGDSTRRHTELSPHWSTDKIKRFGASGVKLLVYYNPDIDDMAEEIEQLTRDVSEQCRHLDLPLFVEPITYSGDPQVEKSSAAFSAVRPELIRKTAERLSACGADVLKLEFPVDITFDDDKSSWTRACEAVTRSSRCPWTLLSAGVDFEQYLSQYDVAARAGASGFVAGRAIWKECVTMDRDERDTFLKSIGNSRLRQLTNLTEELASRWTVYYEHAEADEGWHESYEGLGFVADSAS